MKFGTPYLLTALLLGAGVLAACSSQPEGRTPDGVVTVRGRPFLVETARTPEARRLGLGGRDTLPPGRGMFFVYPFPARRFFWMKSMRFAIDIIWIHGDRVVGIHNRVPAEPGARSVGELKKYHSPEAIDKVLELPAGTCARAGIRVGDRIVYRANQ